MESKKKNRLNATQILVLGILIVILIGSILLKLPISNRSGKSIKYIDSLFISTSCVCVTGLTTVVPVEQFTIFGQVVLMLLIEIGGLGFMSFIALILMLMGKKINLSDRIIIKESLNQNNMKGLIRLIQRIFLYTIIFEGIGAFCNAGFDIIGNNSLVPYQYDVIINITIMLLIIVGGLGFTVWDDIIKSIKVTIKNECDIRRIWKELTTHTKLVLVTTSILLISGTMMTFFLEKNNVQIMKDDNFGQKLIKSSFYSTTLRTAGFYSTNTDSLSSTTKFISMLFMFIGGSPGSTAGGIKNVTFVIIILLVISFIKDEEKTVVFKRKIPYATVKRAVAVVTISICIVALAIVIMTVTERQTPGVEIMDISYEVFSAFGTVGISLGITPNLSFLGKIIIMALMFIGRVGPITLSFALFVPFVSSSLFSLLSFALFSKYNKKKSSVIRYPKCDLLVG